MIRLKSAILIPLLLCLHCLAQAPAPTPATCSISGILTRSGKPVRYAAIGLRRTGLPSAQDSLRNEGSSIDPVDTDENGGFHFDTLAPGTYALYQPRNLDGNMRFAGGPAWQQYLPLTLVPGQQLQYLKIEIQPTGVISGRITDEDGEPLVGVSVRALQARSIFGIQAFDTRGSGSTDDRGTYRIWGLPAGHYRVEAEVSDDLPQDSGTRASRYYPGGLRADKSDELAVNPGEEANADLQIVPVQMSKMRGRVAGLPPGAPRPRVFLGTSGLEYIGSTDTGDKGQFEFAGLVSDDYIVLATSFNASSAPAAMVGAGRFSIRGADLNGVEVTLQNMTAPRIKGTVRVEGSEKHPDLKTYGVGFRPAKQEESGFAALLWIMDQSVTSPNSAGAFEINGLPAASYVFGSLQSDYRPGWEDYYVKRVLIGGQDVTGKPFDLRPGTGVVTAEITLAKGNALVTGTVTDGYGMPMPGATVAVVPDPLPPGKLDFEQVFVSDQNGRFAAKPLSPGGYRFIALTVSAEETSLNPKEIISGELRLTEGQSVMMTLDPGARKDVTLKLVSAASEPQDSSGQ